MDTVTSYLNWNVVTAAFAVIGLLIVVLLAFRAFGGRVRGRRGARLAISEYHEVDKTRRLVLIRRDEVEHLLLIGGAQDLVIETGIGLVEAEEHEEEVYRPRTPVSGPVLTAPARRTEDTLRRGDGEAVTPSVPPRQAPRPPVFGDRSPPRLRPVGRDEPRLAPVREYDEKDKS